MSNLTGENGMVMPVSPMYGQGGGFGGWGDSAWIIILLLFAFGGGGFGGWGMNGGMGLYPWMNQAEVMQGGFNQASTASALTGIQQSITQGFASAEAAACQRAMTEQATSYNNQIATMNQNFANAQALDSRLDSIVMNQQKCCCDQAAATADLKYTIAQDGSATRSTIQDQTRVVLDKLCQLELDAKNDKIADLQNQLNMANLKASQGEQTAIIQAGQRALANEVEQYVLPTPRPAYVVQNPNCCQQFGYCGAA